MKNKKYNLTYLFLSLFSGIGLYLSWYIDSPLKSLWRKLDETTFLFLNGSLSIGDTYAYIWAITNQRWFDLVPGLLLVVIGLIWSISNKKKFFIKRFSVCCMILVYTVISTQIMVKAFAPKENLSPTKENKLERILLTEKFPEMSALKDQSKKSFPGDHGIIMIAFTIGMFVYAGMKFVTSAMIITIIFSIPRLVGGAHWLTDIVVGSIAVNLITMGILYATPLHNKLLVYFRFIIKKIMRKLKLCLGK